MKSDPRLSKEFDMELPRPLRWWQVWPWSIEHIFEVILGNLVTVTLYTGALFAGGLITHLFPLAFWWFLGISGAAFLCVALLFGLVLVANAMDIPHDDMDYPGL